MKILSRYVLREHAGPFLFAATALTSIMLLQFIARRFGDLVGKGLPWQMIAEFFVLSIPFTVAMTLPMAVLVAVLYAFSRLAGENEITAIRAGGISTRRLLMPVLGAAAVLTLAMVGFNDQILPRSNHRLATLQIDIFRAKPTFALREQVINTIKEGQLYLRAGKLDEGSARMREVVIYDLSDPSRRRTIYADSGLLHFAPNQRDLQMTLYDGVMQSVPTEDPAQITRLFYRNNLMLVEGVGSGPVTTSSADTTTKGDREMSVCEMQRQFVRFDAEAQTWKREMESAEREKATGLPELPLAEGGKRSPVTPVTGIGGVYCSVVGLIARIPRLFGVTPAHAATLALLTQAPQPAAAPRKRPPQFPAGKTVIRPPHTGPPPATAEYEAPESSIPPGGRSTADAELRANSARMQVAEAMRNRNRYDVEIQKKFSLAAACLVFVLVGAPVALRFPRGGVGLVLGVSFLIFALYYVALIGGEALADRGMLKPFWAMWGANIVFLVVGGWLVAGMGKESVTSRGGGGREVLANVRSRIARVGRRVGLPLERRVGGGR